MWDILFHWSFVCDVVTLHSNAGVSKQLTPREDRRLSSSYPCRSQLGWLPWRRAPELSSVCGGRPTKAQLLGSPADTQAAGHTSFHMIVAAYWGTVAKHLFLKLLLNKFYFIDCFYLCRLKNVLMSQDLICKRAKHKTDMLCNRVYLRSNVKEK